MTSGTPSQNVDLSGLSFPRCLGVRFNSDFMRRYHLVGTQTVWDSYEDSNFMKKMGKEFHHEGMITREGWAKYFFDGKYPGDIAYIKLIIQNPDTGMLIRTFYFKFKKSYQTTLDGKRYVTDPILGDKIVKNGIMVEMKQFDTRDGKKHVFKKAKTTFRQKKIVNVAHGGEVQDVKIPAIISTSVRYTEKPKIIFLVTPPHLTKYAKLILILIKQLVDLNFDQSYLTKSNQHPLYKTRFMLDEVGNLQSEGHGIANLQTMLSIGLGQDQQFTLILQTLQQLRDVYGDSADKIIQGNTSNIVFLKSTDDSMIDTLVKMSGTTHKSYVEQKSVTRDQEKMFLKNEGKVTYTAQTKEEPVIKYNDFAFIPERNSIVFRAGDSPIWNRNEMILPMSWRLFQNTIKNPGKKYSLPTIPTLSSAMDFDVRQNQPNFMKMLDKRMEQAFYTEKAFQVYRNAYGYSEDDDYKLNQLDPDILSDDIMDIINIYRDAAKSEVEYEDDASVDEDEYSMFENSNVEDNEEQLAANAEAMEIQKEKDKGRYAGGMLSMSDLMNYGYANHQLDAMIVKAYRNCKGKMEQDKEYFSFSNGNLCSTDGTPYIVHKDVTETLKALNEAMTDENSRVYGEEKMKASDVDSEYAVTDSFYQFLVSIPSWDFANGEFERHMTSLMTS